MRLDLPRHLPLPWLLFALLAGCAPEAAPGEPAAWHPLEVPAVAGSTGAHLAAGDGTLVLSWVEPHAGGHALRYARLGASGWSEPRTAASGTDWFVNWADFPSVVPLSAELWAAHWLVRHPAGGYAYDVLVSLSADRGASWSAPVRPHDDGTATEHGFVSLFPRPQGAGVLWLDGRNLAQPAAAEAGVPRGTTLRTATVTPRGALVEAREIDSLTCDCCRTDVARAGDATVAVYRGRTADEIRDIFAVRLAGDGWERPRPVADDGWQVDGCPVNGPAIASDGDRLAAAWFTGADGAPRVRLARSDDAGRTWSAPVDVASGSVRGHAGIEFLPGARVAVSWICEREAGASVCLGTVSPDGTAGPVQVVSGEAKVPPLSVPQLARDGDRLVVAWTEESAGTTRLASAAIDVAALP